MASFTKLPKQPDYVAGDKELSKGWKVLAGLVETAREADEAVTQAQEAGLDVLTLAKLQIARLKAFLAVLDQYTAMVPNDMRVRMAYNDRKRKEGEKQVDQVIAWLGKNFGVCADSPLKALPLRAAVRDMLYKYSPSYNLLVRSMGMRGPIAGFGGENGDNLRNKLQNAIEAVTRDPNLVAKVLGVFTPEPELPAMTSEPIESDRELVRFIDPSDIDPGTPRERMIALMQ